MGRVHHDEFIQAFQRHEFLGRVAGGAAHDQVVRGVHGSDANMGERGVLVVGVELFFQASPRPQVAPSNVAEHHLYLRRLFHDTVVDADVFAVAVHGVQLRRVGQVRVGEFRQHVGEVGFKSGLDVVQRPHENAAVPAEFL